MGDHLGVLPANDQSLVEALGQLLDADMDLRFSLVNLDGINYYYKFIRNIWFFDSKPIKLLFLEENLKKNPFPCPCTIRTAFTYYVDICAPVKSNVMKTLASFTSDENEKERLVLLSTASEQGLVSFQNGMKLISSKLYSKVPSSFRKFPLESKA